MSNRAGLGQEAREFPDVPDLVVASDAAALNDAASNDAAGEATPARRHGERQTYREVNLMAPYDGERLPTQAEFRPVQCRDLSASGFSFLAYQRPSFSRVVLALGDVPPKFFTARVVRVEATGPTSPLVVGCQFERRLLP